MANKWKDVRKPLSPEVEERIRQGVTETAAVMTLHKIGEVQIDQFESVAEPHDLPRATI